MPVKKAAKKDLRKNRKRRLKNLRIKKDLKEKIKKIRSLVDGQKIEEAKKALMTVYQALDKAVKKKVIKKNTASRKKSRLTLLVNKSKKAKKGKSKKEK